jgi:trans-2,3-dihydro-3-hydroxyanthranilate isomerase
MKTYHYAICDVFTDQRFGGNQLAVFPHADGLSTEQMQSIAREFNFSESAFVFPGEGGCTRRVRIFTPVAEMPFAGHPNVGTAFVLATSGELDVIGVGQEIRFLEEAGIVPISIQPNEQGALVCELEAPQELSLGKTMPAELVARAVSLSVDDIVCTGHPPRQASVGFPFLMVELRDLDALQRARANLPGFDSLAAMGIAPDIHLYVHSHDEFDIRARMFAPYEGVGEDPATGSANCALAGLLAHLDDRDSGDYAWRIAQGVEMGRPSVLNARARKEAGQVKSTWIGGQCVLVAEGKMYLG